MKLLVNILALVETGALLMTLVFLTNAIKARKQTKKPQTKKGSKPKAAPAAGIYSPKTELLKAAGFAALYAVLAALRHSGMLG